MSSFTAMSWNIDARGDGLEARIGALARFEGDVVVLQEVPRRSGAALANASGFAWAELAVMHSEPVGGSSARLGTAILGSDRVRLREVGQIPQERFIEAGVRAGLSEAEVRDRTGWFHRNLYADVEIDGVRLRVCSLHARPATGGRPGRPPLGYTRQLFHRVCADWLAEHHGPMLFGVDANSPYVDHPDPALWQPSMAGDATLIGPHPRHHLTDALYLWLDDHPEELEKVCRERPEGPLAISYVTSGAGRRVRYDHLFVTDDLRVEHITYRPPGAEGSDHGAILARLAAGSGGPLMQSQQRTDPGPPTAPSP
jgi:endonuclease/exonuclease/phosphatase family metal-dependent hydrolase